MTPFDSRPTSHRASRRAVALGAAAAAAAAGFGSLAHASARRDTAAMDDRVHDVATPDSQHPARRVARALGPVGKWWTYVPAALGIAAFLALTPAQGSRSRLLARRSRRRARSHRGAAAVALSGAAAFALGEACDRWLPQPPSPPGHDDPCKPVFPSGHTLGPAAVEAAKESPPKRTPCIATIPAQHP